MPVWGDVLTTEQMDALVAYTLNSAKGTSLEIGQTLFAANCSPCHGDFGEGGPNPARAGDVIAPISTSEYLKTRDDFTLRAVISQGQPNFGMSPFGSGSGGPLDDSQIDAIVSYMRSWEANPPVELPPEIAAVGLPVGGAAVYKQLCAQCHGLDGTGGVGLDLSSPQFQNARSDQEIFNSINLGHETTAMISWGTILTSDQIQQLVELIRQFAPAEGAPGPTPAPGEISFSKDVLPILNAKCKACHGTMGGWDGASYETVINSGDHGPAVIPGDPDNSLLAQKLLGTQPQGGIMPPGGKLAETEIQVILNWITAGAPEN
jgi:mono/diheme cytochrome c family protein